MKRGRRFIGILFWSIVVAVMASGCRKQDQEPQAESIAGAYRLNRTPMYCEFEAVDPKAVAVTVDGTEMTYASINGMIMLLLGQVVCDENIDITFQADGTATIDYAGNRVIPDSAAGLPADALTYRVADGSIYLSVGEQVMLALMRELEIDPSEYVSRSVELKFRYTLSGGQLSMYIDKDSVAEVADVFQNVFGQVETVLGDSPAARIVAEIVPQLPVAIDGYRKFNIGVTMTRL